MKASLHGRGLFYSHDPEKRIIERIRNDSLLINFERAGKKLSARLIQ